MSLRTVRGPFGKRVYLFDLEDLSSLDFKPRGTSVGFAFIDTTGRIHLEWNHLRILIGSLFQMFFRPSAYYRVFAERMVALSLVKDKKLLGGFQFMLDEKTRELVILAIGLLPRDSFSPTERGMREQAFGRLTSAMDLIAQKTEVMVGITATDHIPPPKMARIGWLPFVHRSFLDSLRHRWLWFPVLVRHFYRKSWRPQPGA